MHKANNRSYTHNQFIDYLRTFGVLNAKEDCPEQVEWLRARAKQLEEMGEENCPVCQAKHTNVISPEVFVMKQMENYGPPIAA